MTSSGAGAASGGSGDSSGFIAMGGRNKALGTTGFSAHSAVPISPPPAGVESVTVSGNPPGAVGPQGRATLEGASKIDTLIAKSHFGTAHKRDSFCKMDEKGLRSIEQMKELIEESIEETFTDEKYKGAASTRIDVTGYLVDLKLETLQLYYKEDGQAKVKVINLKKLAEKPESKIGTNLEAIRQEAKKAMANQGILFDSFQKGETSELVVGKTPSFDSRVVGQKKMESFEKDVGLAVGKTLGVTHAQLKQKQESFKTLRKSLLSKAETKLQRAKLDLDHKISGQAPQPAQAAAAGPEKDIDTLRKEVEDLEKMVESLSFEDPLKRGDDLRGSDVDLSCAIAVAVKESQAYTGATLADKEVMKRKIAKDLATVVADYKVKGVFNFMKNKFSNLSHGIKGALGLQEPGENPNAHDAMQKASKQFATDVVGLLYHFDPKDSQTEIPKREKYLRLCQHEDFKTTTAPEGIAQGLLVAADAVSEDKQFDTFAEFLGLDIRD